MSLRISATLVMSSVAMPIQSTAHMAWPPRRRSLVEPPSPSPRPPSRPWPYSVGLAPSARSVRNLHVNSASRVGTAGFWIGVSIGPGFGDSYTNRDCGATSGTSSARSSTSPTNGSLSRSSAGSWS